MTDVNVSPTLPRSGLMTAEATTADGSADETESRSWPGTSMVPTRKASVSVTPVTRNVTALPSTSRRVSMLTPARSGNVRR